MFWSTNSCFKLAWIHGLPSNLIALMIFVDKVHGVIKIFAHDTEAADDFGSKVVHKLNKILTKNLRINTDYFYLNINLLYLFKFLKLSINTISQPFKRRKNYFILFHVQRVFIADPSFSFLFYRIPYWWYKYLFEISSPQILIQRKIISALSCYLIIFLLFSKILLRVM